MLDYFTHDLLLHGVFITLLPIPSFDSSHVKLLFTGHKFAS